MPTQELHAQVMFKIQKSVDGNFIVFILSGRMQAAHLVELQQLLESEADDQKIVLDLHEVKLVDREAVRFLVRCEVEGITLVHCPAYIRAWIEREKGQS